MSSVTPNNKFTWYQKISFVFLGIYKYLISPLFVGVVSCRYSPCCSEYMKEAIAKHGAQKGIHLGIRRFLACHPFSRRPRYDPVPVNDHRV